MTIKGMLREVCFYGDEGDVASLAALCPACGFEHNFNVDMNGHGKWNADSPVWEFNGDYDKPTFSPSMGANVGKHQEHHPVCHSYLTDGIWLFQGDSTHGMANQCVPMIPPEADATFKRRHGWHLFPWTDDEGKPL